MFKPMLAFSKRPDLAKLVFPVLVSPKLDGIRCLVQEGRVLSRNLKPIPNAYVRTQLAGLADGVDGELMVEGGFNAVQSAIMSEDGEPDFTYCTFDFNEQQDLPFEQRLAALAAYFEERPHHRVEMVPHVQVASIPELLELEQQYVGAGFEGAMIRSLAGRYKQGRSTEREGWLLKLKQFESTEAVVIGAVQLYENDNEAKPDELGRSKRSSARAGKRPVEKLGALEARTPAGIEFEIGSGFTDEQKIKFWAERAELVGRTVTYKHQPDPAATATSKPRFPVFIGFRHEDDQ